MNIKLKSFLIEDQQYEEQMELKEIYLIENQLENLKNNFVYKAYNCLLPEIEKNINLLLKQSSYFHAMRDVLSKKVLLPEEIEIEIYFVQKDYFEKNLHHYFGVEKTCLGVCVNTGGFGIIRSNEEDNFNTKMQVVVKCETNEEVLEHLNQRESLYSILNTLTHEIFHHLLVIKMAGGLTPYEIEDLYETNDFDYSFMDCSLGLHVLEEEGFIDDISNYIPEEYEQVMEEYVEEKSMDFLEKLQTLKSPNFDQLIKELCN